MHPLVNLTTTLSIDFKILSTGRLCRKRIEGRCLVHAESATRICGLLPYPCGLMSSWAFVLGDSVLRDFVLGAFVRIPTSLYRPVEATCNYAWQPVVGISLRYRRSNGEIWTLLSSQVCLCTRQLYSLLDILPVNVTLTHALMVFVFCVT